jgi:hypothetical protein
LVAYLAKFDANANDDTNGPARRVHYGLPSWQFQLTFDQLTEQGYRLIVECLYIVNGQVLFAGIFEQRSGPAMIARSGLIPEQFQCTLEQLTDQGFRLVNVNGYVVNGQTLYAAIYERSKDPARKIYHGLTSPAPAAG